MTRDPQRGSAMLVTMIVISSLIAGAAVLVSMQLASNRATDVARTGLAATYCAEAGLSAARAQVAANYTLWNNELTSCNATYPCAEPAWLSQTYINHDIDNDNQPDFQLYIRDNDDELPPGVNDPKHDSDLRIFVVSRCIKYADTPKEVEELVEYSGGGTNYRTQQGLGRYSSGNNN